MVMQLEKVSRTIARWVGPSILAVVAVLFTLAIVGWAQHARQDDTALHEIIGLIQSGRIAVAPAK
jgi:hypothetical protein